MARRGMVGEIKTGHTLQESHFVKWGVGGGGVLLSRER